MLATTRNHLGLALTAALVFCAQLVIIGSAWAQETAELDNGVVKLLVKYRAQDDTGIWREGSRVGSGFIIRCDSDLAYIVTAKHVVEGIIQDSPETGVIFNERPRAKPMSLNMIDQQFQDDNGLALLSVSAADARAMGARALPLSPKRFPAKGTKELLIIGHPVAPQRDWEWKRGEVSAHRGEIFYVGATVSEGNSGGPVLLDGQVVGIVLNQGADVAEVKPVVNVRNYAEGWSVTPVPGLCSGAQERVQQSTTTDASATSPPAASAPALAKLTVRSNVLNDRVAIDGKGYGATRLDVELPAGRHSVRVEKDGYEPWEQSVDLTAGEEKTLRAKLQRPIPPPGATFRDCDVCPEMVSIPAGSFQMGSPTGEDGRQADEGPVHRVAITEPFALATREVTVGEFRRFVDAVGYRTEAEQGEGCPFWDGAKWVYDAKRNWRTPGFAQGDDHPVVCVSWNDAKAYLAWLNKKAGQTYRLPSEAEWEYAARARTTSARFWGERPDRACAYANVADKAAKRQFADWTIHDCDDGFVYTAPVGSYKANAFGLKDMLGNAWEWTEDCWNDSYSGAPRDGSAWSKGDCKQRVLRGGSWGNSPGFVRSAYRNRFDAGDRYDDTGFRPARTF